MTQNGQFIKRGVLTSRDMVESNLQSFSANNQPTITQVRKEIFINSNAGAPNVVINKAPNLTAEELNQTKYVNSLGIQNGRQESHFTYSNSAQSNFIPPPPSRFLVNSGHYSGPQPSQLPVHSNHLQNIQQTTVQPLFQSIRKTYVPQHFVNNIPLMSSQTKYYQQPAEEEINDHDEKMLMEYEKVYQKYLEELEKNEALGRKIEMLEQQLSRNEGEQRDDRSLVREVVHTKEVYVNKPTRVDTKQLVAILMKRLKPMMDDTFQRRKASCINKLKLLLNDQESLIKTAMVRSSQQFTVRYKTH